MYDIIVIGAGAIGSYTAYGLAKLGYKIAILEQKQAIGSKVCCSGIISRECYDLFCPDDNTVLREVRAAKLFAPSGQHIRLEKDAIQAYIVDRTAFDIALAKKAQKAGVEYLLQSHVTHLTPREEGWEVELSRHGHRQRLEAKVAILACGFGSTIPEKLGLGKISRFSFAAQAKVDTKIDEVEIYFDQDMAPGGFSWLVPTSDGKGLAGVISRRNARLCLDGFLTKLMSRGKIYYSNSEIRQKAIPLRILPHTYSNRLLVVGEAAGQVKPTTGGGIYFGLLCADLAVATLHRAFLADDLSPKQLSAYQREWQRKLGPELRISHAARQLYNKISRTQIERLLDIIRTYKIDEKMLQWEDYSFDFHGRLILKMLRQPKLLLTLATPKLVFSIGSIAALWLTLKNRSGLRRS